MRILLTNDDGIHAPGIVSLHEVLTDPDGRYGGPLGGPKAQVLTIAPLTVQSATGHGITFHKPLMAHNVQVTPRMSGIAVDGRPADCVKLGICCLWPEHFGAGSRPDLIISGMNSGANCGINVIYSGTVAAAIEGAFLGIPSIAVSLHMGTGRARYDVAVGRARRVIDAILAAGALRAHDCLSINLPVTESGGPMPPVRVCPMNTHGLVDKYERRISPDGSPYYWPAGHGLDFKQLDGESDVDYLMRKCITVTPLSYDLTSHARTSDWRDRLKSRLPDGSPAAPSVDAGVPSPVDQGD
ncbi:MAG: 5'/3'-nucleotidase SurE [Planctomycetota bacterium]